jgi:NO-binding membrane sensor protein with MHYT domain
MEFTYDSGLVALSIVVAILGSFTGLVMTTGIHRVSRSEARVRVVLGGIGIGGGVWSMHFIAMLAVQLPVPLSYSVIPTSASALIAVIGTAIALVIVSSRWFGEATLPVSAVFLGLGIGGMHYLGMYGIRGSCLITYSWLGVSISVLIAIQASAVALWFAFRQRGVLDTLLGSIALGLAIAMMHYSGMEATRFLPGTTLDEGLALLWSEKFLAFAITVTIYSVCSLCLIVFSFLTLASWTNSSWKLSALPLAMDKSTLAQRLMRAQEHVARGERYLRRQRRTIEQLEREGSRRAAAAAKALLETFETSQNNLIVDRDRIKQQLAQFSE